ncbi:Hypothetical protein SMAX5B_016904 [Scophthalmus maximus]|uniref:Uncharacterized protein n=1 Tax=Scophthalmus maximus TaxID=52904 RepID=A0A2U9CK37_SCOMX|nr:Hypothetical protein SMAX5B_016904 [Scophthalmus maximus]
MGSVMDEDIPQDKAKRDEERSQQSTPGGRVRVDGEPQWEGHAAEILHEVITQSSLNAHA